MELGELDIAEKVFKGIYDDNNDNEEAKAMIVKVKKEKQRLNTTTKERWGGKLGGAAPVSLPELKVSSPERSLLTKLSSLCGDCIKHLSWSRLKMFLSENIEYIVGAFFATVAVGVFYHICDRILYRMPSRS